MSKVKALFRVIDCVLKILTTKQKKRSIGAFFSMLFASLFELLGVSLIVPFIMAIMSADSLMSNRYVYVISKYIGIRKTNSLIVFCAILVVIVYLAKNILLLFSRYIQSRYCQNIQKDISVTMLRAYMEQPYEFFVNTNSAEILRGVEGDVASFRQILATLFSLLAELITVLLIVGFIFISDFSTAVMLTVLSIVIILVITFGTKNVIRRVSVKSREANAEKSKAILQLVGGIKDIYVTQRKKRFLDEYEKATEKAKNSSLTFEVVQQLPERVIEFFVVSGIILIVSIRVLQGYDSSLFIPQLGALALASFRLLPSLNKIIGSFNQVVYYYPGMQNVFQNITEARNSVNEKLIGKNEEFLEDTRFNSDIKLKDIEWKYKNAENKVIEGLELTIHKGESIALIGKSGAGKTTLADVLLGLLKPQSGTVTMDGIDIFSIPIPWSKHIGYVPQTVFLTDDTIRNNVAFGLDESEIDDNEIWRALADAQLDEFVKSLPEGLDTIVGERGIKFSGGQRQRIAIARVMYYNPEILVLDEATSALDDGTEKAVMEAIDSLQGSKTLIIIAHRLSTIKNCDKIYEIVDGKAVERSHSDIFDVE